MGNIKLPEKVEYILNKLNDGGYEAYAVGGCIRDMLMNNVPNDWDVCTSALPQQIIEVFSDYQIIPTGLKHGTVTIVIDKESFEVTTFRVDGEYENNRHPKKVLYTQSLHKDLMRRDFTINALVYNLNKGIVDIVGGLKDIKSRTIRCVGNAEQRFQEDALRMLRAIRFATRYSFKIHHKTKRAILDNKELLKNISVERINSEIVKTLSSEYVDSRNCYLLATCIQQIIPEIDDDSIMYISHQIEKSPADIYVRLALMFNFEEGKLFEVLNRLKFDNNTIKKICNVSKYGKYLCYFTSNVGENTNLRFISRLLLKELGNKMAISSIHFASLLQEYKAHLFQQLIKITEEEVANNSCCSISQMQINGNDLINLGFCGKEIGRCLDVLLLEIMQDKLQNNNNCLIRRANEIKESRKES